MTLESDGHKLCLVLIAGLASMEAQHTDFPSLGKRMSPFEHAPPWSVCVPPQDKVEVTTDSDLKLTVYNAPDKGRFPARLIRPEGVGVEHRGRGCSQRRVHNILPDSAETDCLLVVGVYIDKDATSSWPSYEHDTIQPDKETQLEETYYHRFGSPQGFVFQRVYTGDRNLDTCMTPYNHDVMMVPRGYHPVAATVGYDSYYLNMTAGPDRKWLFTWEDDHAWISTPEYLRYD